MRDCRGLLNWVGLWCVCLIVFSGCALRITPTPEPVTIHFVNATFESDIELYEEWAEDFHERYPHITVEVHRWQPWAGADRDDVDVIAVNGGRIDELREAETIVPLNPYLQADEGFDLEDLHAESLEHFSYEGERWAIPAGMTVSAMWYNRDLFDEYGVSYPEPGWTWDDFLEKAVALRDPGAGVYGYATGEGGFDTIAFIYQHGGRIVDDLYEPEQVVLDDPLTVEALEWYAQLIHDYEAVMTPERARVEHSVYDPIIGVVVGKVGMWMDSLAGTREVKLALDWGVAPLPQDVRFFTPASIYGYAMSAQTAYPDESWKWISFLSEQIHPGLVPARMSVLESEEYEDRVGVQVVDVAWVSFEEAETISYWRLFTGFQREMRAFGRAVEDIIEGEITAQEGMERAQREARGQ